MNHRICRLAGFYSVFALATLAFASANLSAQSGAAASPNQAAPASSAQTNPADPHQVPVMDGGIGSCTVDFTVTDNAGTGIYDAKIKVHIAYGFFYARKLDLEQATNIDGKARFIGLPARTKRGLFFQASQGDRTGSAFVDPDKTCNATLTIVLEKKN
jgi:hypothetical protein